MKNISDMTNEEIEKESHRLFLENNLKWRRERENVFSSMYIYGCLLILVTAVVCFIIGYELGVSHK